MFGCFSECFSGWSDDADDHDDLNLEPIFQQAEPDMIPTNPAAVAANRTSSSSHHTSNDLQLPSTDNTSSNHLTSRNRFNDVSAVDLRPTQTRLFPSHHFQFSSPEPAFPSHLYHEINASRNEASIGCSRDIPGYIEPNHHWRQPDTWNAQLVSRSAFLEPQKRASLTQVEEESSKPQDSAISSQASNEDSPSSHSSQTQDLLDSASLQVRSATPETFEETAANFRKLPLLFDADNSNEAMEDSTSSGVSLFSYNNAIGAGASSDATPTTRRRPKRECVVCSEESSHQHPFPTQKIASTCAHKSMTCKSCLRAWILAQLDSSTWDHIACPECDELMQHGDVRLHASAADFRRYDNLALSSYLSSEEGFFRCLAPRCGAGQIHPSGAAEPIFRCGSCQTRSCIVCNVLWHENRTCAQYQQELVEANRTDEQRAQHLALVKTQEEASAATLEGISKICPRVGCGARIQKNGGCDHMTCSKCKYDFCWLCSADYNEIRRVGNEAHAKTCRWRDPEAGDMHEADEGEDDEDEEDDQDEADHDENDGNGNENDGGNEHNDGNNNDEGNNNEDNDLNNPIITPENSSDRNSMTAEFTQGPRNMNPRPLAQPGRFWINREQREPAARGVDWSQYRAPARQHRAHLHTPRVLTIGHYWRNEEERIRQRERARRERERGQQIRETAELQRAAAEFEEDRTHAQRAATQRRTRERTPETHLRLRADIDEAFMLQAELHPMAVLHDEGRYSPTWL